MNELKQSLAPFIAQATRLQRFQQGINQPPYRIDPRIAQFTFISVALKLLWTYTAYSPLDPNLMVCDEERKHCRHKTNIIFTKFFLIVAMMVLFACAQFWRIDTLPNVPNGFKKMFSPAEVSYAELILGMEKKYGVSISIDRRYICPISQAIIQNPVYYAKPDEEINRESLIHYDAMSIAIYKARSAKEMVPHTNRLVTTEVLRKDPEFQREIEQWILDLNNQLSLSSTQATQASFSKG